MSDAVVSDEQSKPKEEKNAFRILFLIVVSDMLGFGIVIPLLPFYAIKFGASVLGVTLMLSVASLCQFISAPILGSLSDRIGRRRVLVFSQLGTVTAGVVLGLATLIHFQNPLFGLAIIYLSRIIDGISGGNVSTAQAYVSDVSTAENKAKRMGMLGAAFGIGFAIGPGIGGVLGHFNPAIPPFLAAALSLTAAIITYLKLPESLKHPVHHQPGWHFVRSARLMKRPILAQLVLIWFLSMFAFVTAEAILALFLKDHYHFDELGVGLMFMIAGIMIIIVQGKLIGPLKKLVGEWSLATIGPICFSIAMVLYGSASFMAEPLLLLLGIGVIFNALGRSLQTPCISTLVSHHAPSTQQGAAFGLFHGMGSLARVFGPALAGLLYDRKAYEPFFFGAGLTLIAAIWMAGIWLQSHRLPAPMPAD